MTWTDHSGAWTTHMGIWDEQEGIGVSKKSTFVDQNNWAKKDIWTDLMRTCTDKKGT